MHDYKKTAKFSLIITYICMVALVAITIGLPYGITWYVETKGRSADLAAVIMLTCYPCVPFAAVALYCIRRFLRNIIDGKVLHGASLRDLKYIALCCLLSGAIMLVGGIFYMPFYISGGAALFCALIFKVIYDMMLSVKERGEY